MQKNLSAFLFSNGKDDYAGQLLAALYLVASDSISGKAESAYSTMSIVYGILVDIHVLFWKFIKETKVIRIF